MNPARRLESEGTPQLARALDRFEAETRQLRAATRGENWTWPPRRDHPGVAGPEPVRFAFRRYLAGGSRYHQEDR